MSDILSGAAAAFVGTRLIAEGPLVDVALAVKAAGEDSGDPLLVFDAVTGAVIDLDLRGDTADIVWRLVARAKRKSPRSSQPSSELRGRKQGRGRPRLGVVPREVTLLPRHWEWLAAQPGGASAALRRLVEQARKSDDGETEARARREAAYRFMTAIAGDLPSYEETVRALFAGDQDRFLQHTADWPDGVRNFAERLAFGTEGN